MDGKRRGRARPAASYPRWVRSDQHHAELQRAIVAQSNSTAVLDVAQHYNQRQQGSQGKRADSVIIGLKRFNNWVKNSLIMRYVKSGSSVVDFCGGKGGDLYKWEQAGIAQLMLLDVAATSVKHARERFDEMLHKNSRGGRDGGKSLYKAEFHARDCFGLNALAGLALGTFQAVSCQFALHYAFESEDRARQAVHNAASLLASGGHFFGTIPNGYRLMKRLRSQPGLSFGNAIYNVAFDQKTPCPPFGHRYTFHLEDAIDDCPEYLVHWGVLVQLAREAGLEPIVFRPFQEYLLDCLEAAGLSRDTIQRDAAEGRVTSLRDVKRTPEYASLMRMNVFRDQMIKLDDWEAAGVYAVFVFRKLP